MKTERLEKIVARAFAFGVVALQNALHENIRVHNSDHAALGVDHGKCEEFVEHEKLACFQNGRLRWQRDYARHHDSRKCVSGSAVSSRRVGTTPTRRFCSSTA